MGTWLRLPCFSPDNGRRDLSRRGYEFFVVTFVFVALELVLKNGCDHCPQGLKPTLWGRPRGTAEAVPFPRPFAGQFKSNTCSAGVSPAVRRALCPPPIFACQQQLTCSVSWSALGAEP